MELVEEELTLPNRACIKLARQTIQVAGYIVSAGAGFSHSRYDVDISGIPSHALYKISTMVVDEDGP